MRAPIHLPRIAPSIAVPAALAAFSWLNAKWGISGDAVLIRVYLAVQIRQYRLEKADRVNPFYWLEESAASSTTGPRDFLWFEGRSYTYKEVLDIVLRYAHWLKLEHQIASGDVVAIDCMNSPEFVFTTFALWSLGAKPAFINYNLSGDPLVHCIRTSNARVVLAQEAIANHFTPEVKERLFSTSFRQDGGGAVEISVLSGHLADKISMLSPHREPDSARSGAGYNEGFDKMGALIFTSGTTGLPKPAVVSWAKYTQTGPLMQHWGGLNKDDILFTCMPLYHATAQVLGLMACQYVGACCAIGKKFSASSYWDDVRASNATAIQYIGETNRFLLAAPEKLDPTTGKSLDKEHRVTKCYGNGMRPDVWDRFKDRFGIETVGEFYTATEAPMSSSWNLSRNAFTSGSIGKGGKLISAMFRKTYKIARVNIETEEPVRDSSNNDFLVLSEVNEPGEMIFRLDPTNIENLFQGYYGNKAASSKKIIRDCFEKGDAWYRTGDILRIDSEGRQYFVDRIGDTFRWRGENVATSEVSEMLGRHAAISEANVYGVEVPRHDGRAGCAALTLSKPLTDDLLNDLAQHATKNLPKYAIPIFLRVTQDQMVTGNNKQQKHIFRSQGVDLSRIPTEDQMYYFTGNSYAKFTEKEWNRLQGGQMKL